LIYEYLCEKCSLGFDVSKTVKELERQEPCPACGDTNTKRLFSPRIYFNGASVQSAEYNPGLGCVVKSKQHRAELAKQKGLIEVGSETTKTLHRESVVRREQEREKEWEKL
jgi:putative FmdB family regulatory protein